jgi:hypothetical protein
VGEAEPVIGKVNVDGGSEKPPALLDSPDDDFLEFLDDGPVENDFVAHGCSRRAEPFRKRFFAGGVAYSVDNVSFSRLFTPAPASLKIPWAVAGRREA